MAELELAVIQSAEAGTVMLMLGRWFGQALQGSWWLTASRSKAAGAGCTAQDRGCTAQDRRTRMRQLGW